MHLQTVQDQIVAAVKAMPQFDSLPVFSEDEGDIAQKLEIDLARTQFAVIVGGVHYEGDGASSKLISGTLRFSVDVVEQPVLNRSEASNRPTALEAAELIAHQLHCLPVDGGVVVFGKIRPPQFANPSTVVRTVEFSSLNPL